MHQYFSLHYFKLKILPFVLLFFIQLISNSALLFCFILQFIQTRDTGPVFEIGTIAIQVENIKPARPLTHDLFKNMCDQLGIKLKEVMINDLVEGIFHAKLG